MKYRKLGRTDIEVSVICLGTMTWGEQNTESEGHAQMDYALERGLNFFDTAELYAIPPRAETYGRTEEIIGTWFAADKARRERVILASKIVGVGLPWVRGGDYKIDKANIDAALEASLKRLQTDYIDLYQLHWPNRGSYHFSNTWGYDPVFEREAEEANFIEVLETLDGYIKQGKIRTVGLSNETAWGTMKYLALSEKHNLPRMVSIQNEYSLICRLFERDLQEIALAEDIGLLAWSPLATGMLSGKYIDGARPEGSRWALSTSGDHYRFNEQSNEAVKAYMDVAERFDLDVAQMALAFVNQQNFVTSNIIGATSMEQLKSNIDSIDIELGKEILDALLEVQKRYPLVY